MAGRGRGGSGEGHEDPLTRRAVVVAGDDVAIGDDWVAATVATTARARSLLSEGVANCAVVVHDPPAVDAVAASSDLAGTAPVLAVVPDDDLARRALAAGATDVFLTGDDPDSTLLDHRLRTLGRAGGREALMHYREVLEAVAGMVFALDESGEFTLVTAPFADRLGYDREELLGQHVSAVLSADDSKRAARLYEELLVGDEVTTTFEGESVSADGETFPVEVEVSLLTDEDGEFSGAVGLVQDISELQEARQRLREQRDRFTYLFDNLPDAVVEVEFVDGEPIVRSVNPTFEGLFGYDEREVLGESIDEFVLSPPGDDDGRQLNQRAGRGEEFETEVRRGTADGRRHFLLRVVPYDEPGGGTRSFAIYTDITEQKQREQSLQVINRVLRHNLRNDLNVLAGYAREITGETDDESVARAARCVRETADDLVSLSERGRAIQAVIRSEASDEGPIDVVETVESVVADFRERFPEAVLSTDLPDRLPVEAGDRIGTVVESLVENAIVHNEGEPRVAVRADGDAHWTDIRVIDDGPGIPAAERAVITEDRAITQLTHASGLDLWLVKWIVEGYGGQIEFEESPWGGTTVLVRLPSAESERQDTP